jgi:hypothetical protein
VLEPVGGVVEPLALDATHPVGQALGIGRREDLDREDGRAVELLHPPGASDDHEVRLWGGGDDPVVGETPLDTRQDAVPLRQVRMQGKDQLGLGEPVIQRRRRRQDQFSSDDLGGGVGRGLERVPPRFWQPHSVHGHHHSSTLPKEI